MTERIIELLLDEGKWLAAAMLVSMTAVALRFRRRRRRGSSRGRAILWAMNLFYGCMIGLMAFGHLLGVTIKAFQGTLEGSLWLLVPLGLALAIPAWWLVLHGERFVANEESGKNRTVALNACLGVCLVAFGLHNLPLAVPAVLNIAYQLHSRRAVGWAIVSVNVIAILFLFIGSLVFAASGQSFEQFKGM